MINLDLLTNGGDHHKVWDIHPPEGVKKPVEWLLNERRRGDETDAQVATRLLNLPSARGMPRTLRDRLVAAGGHVSKHLPGMHDQRTHGHRHGVPDFDFGAKKTLLDMIESDDPHQVQFAEQVLDLCKTHPAVGKNLQSVTVWHGVGPEPGIMASAGPRHNGWALNFYPDHCEMYLRNQQVKSMIHDILVELQGDREQPAPITTIAQSLDTKDFVRAIAVHEFGHLVQYHAFVVAWEKAQPPEARQAGFWNSLLPEEISGMIRTHEPSYARDPDYFKYEPQLEEEFAALDPAFPPRLITEYAGASHAEAGAEWFAASHYGLFGANIDHWKPLLDHDLDFEEAEYYGVSIKKMFDEGCNFDRPSVPLLVTVMEALHRENDRMDVSKLAHEPLDRSPKKNWVERTGQLPAYIQHIAKDLHEERGMPMDRAIAVAISRCKLWAAGGGSVKPDTKAKAAKAVAEWEALKAKAHAEKG